MGAYIVRCDDVVTDENGRVVKQGAQVVIGANDQYIGLCRKHWMLGDLGPDFNGQGRAARSRGRGCRSRPPDGRDT